MSSRGVLKSSHSNTSTPIRFSIFTRTWGYASQVSGSLLEGVMGLDGGES
jgi:hypothetical protein